MRVRSCPSVSQSWYQVTHMIPFINRRTWWVQISCFFLSNETEKSRIWKLVKSQYEFGHFLAWNEDLEHPELILTTNDVIANRPLNKACLEMYIKGIISTFQQHQKQSPHMFSFEEGKCRECPNYEWCLTSKPRRPRDEMQWCRGDGSFATIERMERSVRGGRPCRRYLPDQICVHCNWLASIFTAT